MLEIAPSRKSAFVRLPWTRVDDVAQRKPSRKKLARSNRPHSYHGKAATAAPLPKVCSATADAAIPSSAKPQLVAPFVRRKEAKVAYDSVDGGGIAKAVGATNCADDNKSVARHITDKLLASLNCAYTNAFPSQLKRGASNSSAGDGTPPTSPQQPLIEFGAGGGFADVSRTWRFHPFRMR